MTHRPIGSLLAVALAEESVTTASGCFPVYLTVRLVATVGASGNEHSSSFLFGQRSRSGR